MAGALENHFRATGRVDASVRVTTTVLAGGVSNRTVLAEFSDGRAWVLKQALAKLRTKVDWFSDPARIEREAMGLRWLEKLAPAGATTPLVFEDRAHHLLAMQAVPQPHDNLKTLFLSGRVDSGAIHQLATLLTLVHRRAWEQREEVAPAFEDRSFFESLRLEPYYSYAATQVPEAATFLHELIDATKTRRFTLVHGDFSPKNVLVHRGRLVLLDHEVVHWGDGAFDVGFCLTHLFSKAHHLPEHRTTFAIAAREFWRIYLAGVAEHPWSQDLEAFAVRHTLACLLARVAGRSTLEYLDEVERARQRRAVVALMSQPPASVPDLISQFVYHIERV